MSSEEEEKIINNNKINMLIIFCLIAILIVLCCCNKDIKTSFGNIFKSNMNGNSNYAYMGRCNNNLLNVGNKFSF